MIPTPVEEYISAYYPDQGKKRFHIEQVKRMMTGFAKEKCEEQRNICATAYLKLTEIRAAKVMETIRNAQEPEI
jgi:hypothetical protein